MSTRPPFKISRDYRETREALRHKPFQPPGIIGATGRTGKNRAAGFPPCRLPRGRRE